ncbi:PAS domain-containing protein [Bradyrhizobium viridifuturi]|jgi:PAS domain S-box-containing protein|uniref:hybrid sensor histidine kinase/response regulator n=5 Tax=Pseudomonadota TaxID=1224 RepID=UPI00039820A7|nr:hybrid sensor histidine kinase/response regulator [Bradyrhizobium viridifuturi]ERF84165.1 MAG: PAS domain S-box protein [Bradyrhizobium sp. DFCI-1]MCA3570558.1 PAS domain-containing protein [Bradyrhizobium sp.]OYU58880.1 MAG: hybrid sensor histidine kinase/response regulator [Bradyrhizobium sp. PARBB1]PSO25301.1 hybrid sensor histidine kinase/response regulator [Bradyrhizobium sp. MOS004]QRI70549.1 PAS domain-containing protein [Bradyrhizobium sp. PSBB068]
MMPGPSSERAVILAASERDAVWTAHLIKEAGYYANICGDLAELERQVASGAGLAIIADEAVRTADLAGLARWLNAQPSWSDFPIVLMSEGGGPERSPEAARLGRALGNVTFIERPFHPTTLVSLVAAAVRGRRRQYQTRAILEDLTESESLLQTALDAGHLGALELHIPGFELEASATCKRFFGRAADLPFTYQDLLEAVHPDDRARRQEVVEHTLKTGADYKIEYRNIWPDGSQHWVDVRARAVRRPDGSIRSLVGVCSDITARKTAEIEREALLAQLAAERSALAELTATLEQRVEQRTADLMKEVAAREKAQEQLRHAQKMEAIGQLTGGVAHDFNNLLMAVMGNLDLLRKRLPEDPRLHRLVDGALQGAERGASLTQRLLAFARQQDLRAVPVDLGALVRDMSELLERSLGPRIALRLHIPDGLPPACVDTNQLELAVLNLAINARDAMPDGGVIEIRLAAWQAKNEQTRSDQALRPGNYLKLSVIDSGTGMAPDVLKRAIEPFFSSKPVGKGTGLGLSMVHGLAVQLGGALQLSSAVGKGTTAVLVLPVATAAPEAESPAPAARPVRRSAVILLVDDDPLIAMSTMEMLEDLGHRVIGANSGPHALDILRSDQEIDLMMTDHVMPGMTGIELAAASREVRPQLLVLLATGYAELPDGFQVDLPRLAKPYHQDQLRERLDQLLGQGVRQQAAAAGASADTLAAPTTLSPSS